MAHSYESHCLVPAWHGQPLAQSGILSELRLEHVTWRNVPDKVAGRRRSHSHNVFHVVIFNEAQGSCVVDAEVIDMHQRTAILTQPDQPHSFAGIYGEHNLYHEVTFQAPYQTWQDLLAAFFEKEVQVPAVCELNDEQYESFEAVTKRMVQCLAEQPTDSRLYCAQYVQRLLFSVFRLCNEADVRHESVDPWEQLREWIEAHADEQWDLDTLAQRMQCTVKHVSRQFSKRFGTPPLRYKKHILMQRAAVLLQSTDYSLQHISNQLGIFDAHYFNRLFRQHFGIAPARYRKENVAG